MIKLEKMLEDTNPNTDIAADIILSLMKRTYIAGREDGYERGFNDCKNPLADAELDAAYRDGEQAGYIAGREDGYDEACMDLTDDDLGSSLDEDDCTGCFGASFNDCAECRKQEAANG